MGIFVSTNSSASNPRIFYGWFVVAGTFAVTFVGFGCAYSFSAFLISLQHDFAASRGSGDRSARLDTVGTSVTRPR